MIRVFILFFCLSTALIAAPQAVVFDFGGVLTGPAVNRKAIVGFIQESFHFSDEEYEEAHQEKRLALKDGKTDVEFWLNLAKAKGIQLPSDWSESFNAVMKEAIGARPQMYDLVEELQKENLTVGMLSNIDERLAKLIRDFGLYEPFDPCLLSYELGIEKPDPQIYEILLSTLDLPASEVVFIDDRPENIEVAQEMGIDAVLFTSPEEIREELMQRGLLKGTL